MPILKQSRHWTRCEQCAIHFNLAEGGVCRACGRILCETHLYGSWVQRLRRYVGARATCVDCRARQSRGDAPDAPDAPDDSRLPGQNQPPRGR